MASDQPQQRVSVLWHVVGTSTMPLTVASLLLNKRTSPSKSCSSKGWSGGGLQRLRQNNRAKFSSAVGGVAVNACGVVKARGEPDAGAPELVLFTGCEMKVVLLH